MSPINTYKALANNGWMENVEKASIFRVEMLSPVPCALSCVELVLSRHGDNFLNTKMLPHTHTVRVRPTVRHMPLSGYRAARSICRAMVAFFAAHCMSIEHMGQRIENWINKYKHERTTPARTKEGSEPHVHYYCRAIFRQCFPSI